MRWFLIGSAFVLVAVVGMVAGAMLSGSGESASAASSQPREAQITLSTHSNGVAVPGPFFKIALDPADYPSGTVFRFEANVVGDPGEVCVALFDYAANASVNGSDVCATNTSAVVRVRSGPFAIPSGEGEYGLADSCTQGGTCLTFNSRVIAEWNELLVMNPNPTPNPSAVGGMVELISGGSGGGLGRLPEMAAALLLLGVGGIYVVKTRRD